MFYYDCNTWLVFDLVYSKDSLRFMITELLDMSQTRTIHCIKYYEKYNIF